MFYISIGWFKGKNTGKTHRNHGKIHGLRLRFSFFCQPIEDIKYIYIYTYRNYRWILIWQMEDDINGNIQSFHLFEMKDGELIQNGSPSMPTLRTDPAMAPAPGDGGPGQWRWNRLLHRCQAGAIWDIF